MNSKLSLPEPPAFI